MNEEALKNNSLDLPALVDNMLDQGLFLAQGDNDVDFVGVEIINLSLSELVNLKNELSNKNRELLDQELASKKPFNIVNEIRDSLSLHRNEKDKKADECLLSSQILRDLICLVDDEILHKSKIDQGLYSEIEEAKLKLIDDLVREGRIDITSSRKIKLTDGLSKVGQEDDWITMKISIYQSDAYVRKFILTNYDQFRKKIKFLDNISNSNNSNDFFIEHGFCVYIDSAQMPSEPRKALTRAEMLNNILLKKGFSKLTEGKNVSVTIGNEDNISAHAKNGVDASLAITVCHSASPDDNLKYILDAVASYNEHLHKARHSKS